MAVSEKITITADNRTAKAFRDVQNSAKRTAGDLSDMSRKMAGVAVVGAAAATALFLLTKRAVENADAIAKMADATGISTESLQEYRHAAELSGIETEKFDNSLVQFAKRIGEAGAETGSLVEFLNRYDKTLIDNITTTRNTGEALDAAFKIMGDMEKQTDRAAFAAAAFGRSGVVMTNMLRDGTAGLEDMRAEAQRLGLVLDEDMVRGAEAANDAMTRMEKIVGVNLQRVLLSLAPVIVDMGVAFGEAAPQIAKMTEQFAALFLGDAVRSIGTLKTELVDLTASLAEMEKVNARLMARGPLVEGIQALEDTGATEARIATIEALLVAKEKEAERIKKIFANLGGANDNNIADKAAEKERERAEALLLAMEETHLQVMGMDAELIDLRAAQELEKLRELHEAKTISKMEFMDAEFLITQDALERLRVLHEENEAAITADVLRQARIKADADQNLADAKKKTMRDIQKTADAFAGLMQLNNRKAFEVGKAGAVALALAKTYEGAQSVFASAAAIPYVGWAIAPVAMAAAIVTGLANVRAIQSTSFGGGGGGGGGRHGGGISMPSVPSPDVPALAPPADQNQQPRSVNITIESDSGMVSTEWVRGQLAPAIQEALGDGIDFGISTSP